MLRRHILEENRRSFAFEREANPPNRLSIDTAPVAIEMRMKDQEIKEKKKKGQKLTRDELKKEIDIVREFLFHFYCSYCQDEHMRPLEEVMRELETDRKVAGIFVYFMIIFSVCIRRFSHCQTGLTDAEVLRRLERDGPNALTPPKQTSLFLLVRSFLFTR
jgi:hypothetical protein